jgi:hypothetical protein
MITGSDRRAYAGRVIFITIATTLVAGCSSGGVTLRPSQPIVTPTPTATAFATPTAAINTICVTPSTQPQSVSLPNTGGYTGSLDLGAFAAGATGCLTVRLASGADAASSQLKIRAASGSPAPIFTMDISGGSVIVTGFTLDTGNNVFPDGQYYATLNYNTLPPVGLIFVAKNGVLTLQSTGTPIIVLAGTTLKLNVYAPGVTPIFTPGPIVTPTPMPSTSPSSGPSPSPSPSNSPSPLPSSTPSATPTPAPTPAPTSTPGIAISPAACVSLPLTGGQTTYTATLTPSAFAELSPGEVAVYLWFVTGAVDGTTYSTGGPTVPVGFGTIASYQDTLTITVPAGPWNGGSLTGTGVNVSAKGLAYSSGSFAGNLTSQSPQSILDLGSNQCATPAPMFVTNEVRR